jgi:hypothetical protein
MLGRPGVVESVCPATGQPVRVELTPDRVLSVDPRGPWSLRSGPTTRSTTCAQRSGTSAASSARRRQPPTGSRTTRTGRSRRSTRTSRSPGKQSSNSAGQPADHTSRFRADGDRSAAAAAQQSATDASRGRSPSLAHRAHLPALARPATAATRPPAQLPAAADAGRTPNRHRPQDAPPTAPGHGPRTHHRSTSTQALPAETSPPQRSHLPSSAPPGQAASTQPTRPGPVSRRSSTWIDDS